MAQAPDQDFIVSSGLNVQGTSVVTSSTGNTSTLQVDGGAAVAKNLIVGSNAEVYGDLIVRGSMPSLSVTGTSVFNNVSAQYTTSTQLDVVTRLAVGGLSQLNNVTLSNLTNSTSSTTGALQVSGGVGIQKDLWVGGKAFVGGFEVVTTATVIPSTLQAVTAQGNTSSYQILLQNTSASTSTQSGALVVTGGVGVGGALWVNDTSYVADSQILTTATIGQYAVATLTAGTDTAVNTSSGLVIIWNTSTLQTVTDRGAVTSNALTITNTDSSTSTTSGALIVAGGVGIGGDLYVGDVYSSGVFDQTARVVTTGTIDQYAVTTLLAGTDTAVNTATGIVTVWNTSTLQTVTDRGNVTDNQIIINNTMSSTSTLTANALYVKGGVAIDDTLFVHGTAYFDSSVVFAGTTTSIFSTQTVYTDNFLDLHYPAGQTGEGEWTVDDGKDIGFVFHHYKAGTGDEHGALIWHNASDELRWYMGNVPYVGGSQTYDFSTGTLGVFRTGSIILDNVTSSTSTSTGTLVVAGGVGVGGDLYLARRLLVQGSTVSSSPSSGALVVTGGVGVGGDLWIGGTLYGTIVGSISTATNLNGGSLGQIPYQTAAGITDFFGPGTAGNILVSNGAAAPSYNNTLTLAGTIAATSTQTGALQVRGGVGIGGALYVQQTSFVADAQIVTTSTLNQFAVTALTAGTDTVVSTATGAVTVWNNSTLQSVTNRGATTNNAVSITNATGTTTTNAGALTVAGGIGVGGNVYVGNRVGFVNGSGVSAVYQYFNTATNSLDTVFG